MIRFLVGLLALAAVASATVLSGAGALGAQELVPIEEDEAPVEDPAPADPGAPEVDSSDDDTAFAAPLVVLSRYEVNIGDQIVVTAAGFRSNFVTASVCGNAGRRGSQDCNQIASKSMELDADGSPTISDLIVGEPPMPCPCIVRVASSNNDEVAVADITLLGHPVAELVGGSELAEPLAASVSATRASKGFGGWLRSSLGGRTTYDLDITLRNRTSEPVEGVTLQGRAGGGENDTKTTFTVVPPETLAGGETWSTVLQVELGAPVWGTTEWTLDVVAPLAPTVVVTDTTSHLPGLLIVLIVVLAVDLVVLATRFVLRRLRKARWERSGEGDGDGTDTEADDRPEHERREEVVLDLRGL